MRRDLHLVADVFGILCELQPVTLEEWDKMAEFCYESGEEIPFVGLDVFSVTKQTLLHHTNSDKASVKSDEVLTMLEDGRLVSTKVG